MYRRDDHPERRTGEILIGSSDERTYKYISWSTKKRGHVAYDIHDKPYNDPNIFPVFVQQSELIANGIDPKMILRW